MNRDEIFARWAPEGAPWSAWVKPVLFAHVSEGEGVEPARPRLTPEALMLEPAADPYRAPAPRPRDLAVVVDLPGVASVGAGLVLADFGFQPVPLFNALPGPRDLEPHQQVGVDVWPLVAALVAGARVLPPGQASAPPAFLLDSRRLGEAEPTHFDNRSFCNWSDFPSGERLRQAGIRRVLLWGSLRWDVAHTLRRWQEVGLPLFSTAGTAAAPLRISFWARLRHWFESQAFSEGPSSG